MIRKIFRTFSATTILLLTAGLSFGLETGGLFTNDSEFSSTQPLKQKNGLNLWLREALSEDGNCYFALEGQVRNEFKEHQKEESTIAIDATLAKLVLRKDADSGSFEFSAGRFYDQDLSGIVYAQNGDGAKIALALPKIEFSILGAYTGLLNAKNITILRPEEPVLLEKERVPYIVAKKYAIGKANISIQNLLVQQNLSFEGLAAFSLEKSKYNRFYTTLKLDGPLIPSVFYEASSTFGFFKKHKEEMTKANLSKASITAYPSYKSMSISLNGLYASGEQGDFEAFQGFTSGTATFANSEPEYTQLALLGIAGTIKPAQNLLLKATGDIVFDAKKEIEQTGVQFSAEAKWQAASDLSLGAGLYQYFGKETTVDDRLLFKLNAVLAF